MELTNKTMNAKEFEIYCKNSSNTPESKIIWELSNGDEIYFQWGFKKPHIVSPEPIKGGKYGDYGYEKAIDWSVAFSMLEQDGQFEPEDEWED